MKVNITLKDPQQSGDFILQELGILLGGCQTVKD